MSNKQSNSSITKIGKSLMSAFSPTAKMDKHKPVSVNPYSKSTEHVPMKKPTISQIVQTHDKPPCKARTLDRGIETPCKVPTKVVYVSCDTSNHKSLKKHVMESKANAQQAIANSNQAMRASNQAKRNSRCTCYMTFLLLMIVAIALTIAIAAYLYPEETSQLLKKYFVMCFGSFSSQSDIQSEQANQTNQTNCQANYQSTCDDTVQPVQPVPVLYHTYSVPQYYYGS
jgi:hypothetical protein